MKFGLLQRHIFGTAEGTYSRVTATEVSDSQITLSDCETELVVRHFGENNIHVGNVRSYPVAATKQFLLYPSGAPIELNLFYPKTDKTNLKLCLGHGFDPMKGRHLVFVSQESQAYHRDTDRTNMAIVGTA